MMRRTATPRIIVGGIASLRFDWIVSRSFSQKKVLIVRMLLTTVLPL